MSMKFDIDWDWIMEVKTKICDLSIIHKFNVEYNAAAKGFVCYITLDNLEYVQNKFPNGVIIKKD